MKTSNRTARTKLLLVGTLALVALACPSERVQAQDATAALVSAGAGAAGVLLGNQWVDQWAGAPYAAAAILPAIANFGYDMFKKKSDEDKIKYYISGRNYERWVQSQETWYQSTLNPHTGRPQAFSGLNEMDAGMPDTSGETGATSITHVYTVPVRLPAGTYGGTPYTERITEFPKLP
jgi:hypothetical protein